MSGIELIPTRKVRVKKSGHVCVINAHEFDSSIHEDPLVVKAPPAANANKTAAAPANQRPRVAPAEDGN